jgi:hypothetical protein
MRRRFVRAGGVHSKYRRRFIRLRRLRALLF